MNVFGASVVLISLWHQSASLNIEKVEERTEPGNVTSPRYPGNYPPMQNCTWNFRAESGKWAVIFQKFDLQDTFECKGDSVTIRDLNDWSHSKRHCGNQLPDIFMSRTSWLQIHFRTDWVEERPGFLAMVYYGKDAATLEYELRVNTDHYASKYAAGELKTHRILRISITSALPVVVAVLIFVGSCALWHLFRHQRRNGVATRLVTNPRYLVPQNNRSTKSLLAKLSRKFRQRKQEKVLSVGLQKLEHVGTVKMVPNPAYTSQATASSRHLFIKFNSDGQLVGEPVTPVQYTSVKFVDLPPELDRIRQTRVTV